MNIELWPTPTARQHCWLRTEMGGRMMGIATGHGELGIDQELATGAIL